jgi:hypothetical protein
LPCPGGIGETPLGRLRGFDFSPFGTTFTTPPTFFKTGGPRGFPWWWLEVDEDSELLEEDVDEEESLSESDDDDSSEDEEDVEELGVEDGVAGLFGSCWIVSSVENLDIRLNAIETYHPLASSSFQ